MRGPRLLHRTPPPVRAVLAGVAAAAVLTACGGGSGTPSASSSSTPAPSTTSSASSSAGAAASGSDFCTQAQAFATEAGQAVAAGTASPDVGAQLQGLVTQLQSITPPPAIAADWQSATTTLQQFAQAYQGVDLQDPQQVQQLQQKTAPLLQQLTTSGQRIEQYLQSSCGISAGGPSESAAPST